ncbi:response regulator [Noviherbaspirillum sp. CPCC 100848]|uniref:Response regulator n=1 Tax=Noviherbaspirillum album TaxID=3080276 RepID=A0ABU6J399_9BURK|nr:response regulator [Noviherbaspirillum sp. CPCC 100848]MEC4718106.1 response regulator [Noviherbaspirillum sp. CPCC 100848]
MTSIPALVTVIDDDSQVRRALLRVLKMYGYVTQEFVSAEDYLSTKPEFTGCLVLDIDLGGMSGIELYRTILQRDGRAPPTIFVTGKVSEPIEVAVRALGAVDFLVKPVDGQELADAVRRATIKSPGYNQSA